MSYIPSKEAKFVEWSGNLILVSKKYKAEWGLPDAKLTEVETLHIEVKTLHEKCQTVAYTKLDMQAKNEKALLKKKKEDFVRFHLQNNDNIPIYDKNYTLRPVPTSVPDIEIETPHPRTIRIKFRHGNSSRWGKPEFVHGFEYLWLIADTPLEKVRDLLHSDFATRSPNGTDV